MCPLSVLHYSQALAILFIKRCQARCQVLMFVYQSVFSKDGMIDCVWQRSFFSDVFSSSECIELATLDEVLFGAYELS